MPGSPNRSSINVRKIEAVQVIQSAENDIPLIAGKRTFFRVFLEPGGVDEQSQLVGYITAKIGEIQILEIRQSIEPITLRHDLSLRAQRLDWSQSLNFCLKEDEWDATENGAITINLSSLTVVPLDGDTYQAKITGKNKTAEVKVVRAPEMHCRVIAFKHRDRENLDFIQPKKGEAAAIQRFVECTFPVASIHWSSLTVAAPRLFRAVGRVSRDSDRTHGQITRNYIQFFTQLLAIREQDIINGRDPRTLYLGLIDDPSGRFGGAAMDSPQFAAPHVVALTTRDFEGQLGAHELAHVLGRRHPGIPARKIHGAFIGQLEEPGSRDLKYGKEDICVNPSGFLSSSADGPAGKVHHGLDTRQHGNMPELLPYDQWFDLMTYRYPKWVSNFTYLGLLNRLNEINSSRLNVTKPVRPDDETNAEEGGTEQEWSWTVIGEYDIRRKTGKIHYIAPGNYNTPMPPRSTDTGGNQVVQLAWHTGGLGDNDKPKITQVGVHIRNYKKLDGSKSVGVFQHTLSKENLPEKDKDSFAKLFCPDGSLMLKVLGVVVDEIRGCKISQFDKIFCGIHDSTNRDLPNRPPPNLRRDDDAIDETVNGGLSLQYCLDDGGYYLRYLWYWNKKDTRDLRIITSIACRRIRHLDESGPEWQTVMVNDRLRGRVWISPVFFEKPRYEKVSRDYSPDEDMIESDDNDENESGFKLFDVSSEYSHYGPDIMEPSYLKEQTLEIRIGITVGFHSKFITVKRKVTGQEEVGFTEIEAFGSRNYASPYLPYPGGHKEPKGNNAAKKADEVRFWYRDTGTETEDIEEAP